MDRNLAMHIENSTIIEGLKIITPDVFRDDRGSFVCTWNSENYAFVDESGASITFVEDDLSTSVQNVIRGLHGDDATWKLVQCVYGSLYLVVADMRRTSAGYLRWQNFDLDDQTRRQILIPAGCATGIACLSATGVLAYKQNRRYGGAVRQFTVRWDDPLLNIDWPIRVPILSDRDASAVFLDRQNP
ncbi:MAG: dTDP-4-dehydrorhamnose 3,5-epimerase family protein [Chloroflexi bacterium]|nr:dTDP-4-dehydrorhamnose 3,5-epimerase family protein [Chloroflexota bacterium]